MSLQDDIFDIEYWFKERRMRLAAFHRIIEKLNEVERENELLQKENMKMRNAFEMLNSK